MKKLPVIIFSGLFVSMSVSAEIYKCTDPDGNIHYGDKPCKGVSSIFTPRKGQGADENAEQRMEKTHRLLRAYNAEHVQERQKTAELKAEKEKRDEKCRRARVRYQQIISAGRIYKIDKDGNQTDWSNEERDSSIASGRADIEEWCG